jgi:hypothetical protein
VVTLTFRHHRALLYDLALCSKTQTTGCCYRPTLCTVRFELLY